MYIFANYRTSPVSFHPSYSDQVELLDDIRLQVGLFVSQHTHSDQSYLLVENDENTKIRLIFNAHAWIGLKLDHINSRGLCIINRSDAQLVQKIQSIAQDLCFDEIDFVICDEKLIYRHKSLIDPLFNGEIFIQSKTYEEKITLSEQEF